MKKRIKQLETEAKVARGQLYDAAWKFEELRTVTSKEWVDLVSKYQRIVDRPGMFRDFERSQNLRFVEQKRSLLTHKAKQEAGEWAMQRVRLRHGWWDL